MTEEIAENRGYDRGFTAGTLHAHNLLDKRLVDLEHKQTVAESEGWPSYDKDLLFQIQMNTIRDLKLLIRKGHYDEDSHDVSF